MPAEELLRLTFRPLILSLVVGAPCGSAFGKAKSSKRGQPAPPPLVLEKVEGLPQSQAASITQDSLGFLWFGTQNGLARFDGKSMKTYTHDPANPKSLAGNVILKLISTKDAVWIGTAESGLDRLDLTTGTFEHYVNSPSVEESLSSDGITALGRDTSDNVWVGTGSVLSRLKTNGKDFVHYYLGEDFDDLEIRSIVAWGEKAIWVGTTSGVLGIDVSSGEVLEEYTKAGEHLPSDEVNALLYDQGVLWVGTTRGLVSLASAKPGSSVTYSSSSPRPSAFLSHDHITAIEKDTAGRLWVGTMGGLNSIDATTKAAERFVYDSRNVDTISYPPSVTSAFRDKDGVLFFGTQGHGVRKVDPLRLLLGHYRVTGDHADSFTEMPNGTIWVGTFNSGLFHFDITRNRQTHLPKLPSKNGELDIPWVVSSVHDKKRRRLWLASNGVGLMSFDLKSRAGAFHPVTGAGSNPDLLHRNSPVARRSDMDCILGRRVDPLQPRQAHRTSVQTRHRRH